ncbi:GAF and ANTAR domain-containing protein [Streptomyces ficellus]|uniref:GAF and ANTAR domain-containing protein n=1 Tax=Streptomyces ficellus TaxID=1977088 RepID=A0ABT7ZA37_9ACTN|nr:GAF and ANTAR domain-containing protein [Streptomyces ficellus]MDN3296374.1 GAF and ANTAR domain-containing protein [Streptomyces ficellus]
MTADEMRAARLVAEAAAGAAPEELPRRLCGAACEGLGADGATLSLLTDTPSRQLLAASDSTALLLEEVQFTVLEGPCISAAASGEPVIVDDLDHEPTPWPLFGANMREKLPQVKAVYAFPVYFGDYVLGTMDLLALRPRALPEDAVRQAPEVADAVAAALLPARRQLLSGMEAPAWEPTEDIRAHWFDTHRAVGMVASHKEISPEDALALMRARAFRTGRTLADITADILGQPRNESGL